MNASSHRCGARCARALALALALDTEKLGELRGSGVAHRTGEGWRIAHYVLSVPVPNALLPELVAKIAAHGD